jgi:hypothetical protein
MSRFRLVKLLTVAGTLLLLVASFSGCKGKIDTPEKLLGKIHSLAAKEKYQELRNHIYPLVMGSDNYQDLIIEGIEAKKQYGRCAYSGEALARIVKNHLDRFEQISPDLRDFALNEIQDDELRKILLERPEDVQILRYKGIMIAIVKIEDEYKLLYWEAMNDIL